MNITNRTSARTAKTTCTCHNAVPLRRPARRKARVTPEITRRYIVIGILGLIAAIAIISIWVPAALPVLEKLLPSLGMLCAYYFGQMNA